MWSSTYEYKFEKFYTSSWLKKLLDIKSDINMGILWCTYFKNVSSISEYDSLSIDRHSGSVVERPLFDRLICLCWSFTAQSTQWGHVERS